MPIELTDLVAIGLMTVVSFVFTNLDNLILGVVSLGARPEKPLPVQLGMVSAAVLVLLVLLLALAIGQTIDAGLLGYLGLAPIGIGLYSLLYAGRVARVAGDEAVSLELGNSWGRWLATTTLLFANSGDTIAILLPLLAESNDSAASVVALTFVACALVWSFIARLLSRQPILVRKLQSKGERIVPWVMIAVGSYILFDTGTDSLL